VFVQSVVMPVTEAESWTVLGGDGTVVAPVESLLAYLTALERSPNTVRAYAVSLSSGSSSWSGHGPAGPTLGWRTWPGSCRGYGRQPRT